MLNLGGNGTSADMLQYLPIFNLRNNNSEDKLTIVLSLKKQLENNVHMKNLNNYHVKIQSKSVKLLVQSKFNI